MIYLADSPESAFLALRKNFCKFKNCDKNVII